MPIRRSSPPDEPFRVHPDKLLKDLDATRRAKLGSLYGKFWVAPGVRWPSEFNEQGVWDPLPPKKPAESVRFACEEERLKKASGSGFAVPCRFERVEPFDMAATALDYRKSPQSTSGNRAADSPFGLLEKAKASALHPREREVLVTMLEEGNRFASEGSTNHIYAATLTIAVSSGYTSITVRRSIDRLEKAEVLKLIHPENWAIRSGQGYKLIRPRTYQVNEEKLVPRLTLREHRKRRFGELSRRQQSRHSSPRPSPPTQDAASVATSPLKPADAAPVAGSPAPTITRGEDRVFKLRMKVMEKWGELKRGCDKIVGLDGLAIRIGPGHPEYFPPMSPENAWIAALLFFQISEREAREKLKLSYGTFEDAEPSP